MQKKTEVKQNVQSTQGATIQDGTQAQSVSDSNATDNTRNANLTPDTGAQCNARDSVIQHGTPTQSVQGSNTADNALTTLPQEVLKYDDILAQSAQGNNTTGNAQTTLPNKAIIQRTAPNSNATGNVLDANLTQDASAQTALPEDYQLNLSDFALFLSVMKVKEAYEDVLGIILDEPDLELREVKAEQVVLNKSGKRAIRLDAWALDVRNRQFDMEMQNDTDGDSVRKRSRFYQSLIDTPILKSGKKTRYRHLPSTAIIFITQDDIFGKDLAKYTFRERCEEVPELTLDDGTSKIFLNMTSRNGRPELISLLQYMKNTTLDNSDIIMRDERILDLDRIVQEVKQSEEWEGVKMNILEIGIARGVEQGRQQGREEGIEQGREQGREEGIEQGREQGIEQTSRNIVENMLRHSMPDDEIMMYTGCGQELIDAVRHEINER